MSISYWFSILKLKLTMVLNNAEGNCCKEPGKFFHMVTGLITLYHKQKMFFGFSACAEAAYNPIVKPGAVTFETERITKTGNVKGKVYTPSTLTLEKGSFDRCDIPTNIYRVGKRSTASEVEPFPWEAKEGKTIL